MNLNEEERKAIVAYRLQKAKDTLYEAKGKILGIFQNVGWLNESATNLNIRASYLRDADSNLRAVHSDKLHFEIGLLFFILHPFSEKQKHQ
jgi:hypothetical protein